MNFDPFREMANAMRTKQAFDGTMLKFSKGAWTAGKDGIDMNGRELIALVDRLMFGWVKWEDRRPIYDVGLVAERFKPRKRAELGDLDRSLWERDQDPWQMTFILPLSSPQSDELFFYNTTSRGGRDCLANLQEAFADHREAYPDEAHKLPVVQLARDHYPHPEYGRVETPVLDLMYWVEPPEVKAIKPPAPLPIEHVATPRIEHRKSDGRDFNDSADIPY
jgi:hypothetical protein